MTAGSDRSLTISNGRARGRIPLPGSAFSTSRKIPEEVYATGEARVISDLLDGDLANVHMGTVSLGIRHVICVPLLPRPQQKPVGVLYLDSREKGSLFSQNTVQALLILAAELGDAVERAALQDLAVERGRLEQEMRIGAEVQAELSPDINRSGSFYEAVGRVIPCRAVGGDFLQATDVGSDRVMIMIGDVAGKGTAAGLLASFLLGVVDAKDVAHATAADVVASINRTLVGRRVKTSFSTIFFATCDADGSLQYCNAGQNPPILLTGGAIRRPETGGPVLGLFDAAPMTPKRCGWRPATR
jgi:sigma-B regulation protein RsbU (phosphoserine phosphatase)